MLAHKGRRRIYTDEIEVNIGNVKDVVKRALIEHETNIVDIKYLFDVAKGEMVLSRKKDIRPEIDVRAIDPIASQIVDFKVGFEHGNPISYIQRANVDATNPSGSEAEVKKDDIRIITLNEMMREVKKASKDLKLASDIKKCGVGYRFIYPNRRKGSISPFDISILNPMRTFVIYTNDVYREPIAAVTYTVMKDTFTKRVGVWTKDWYFEFSTSVNSIVKATANPIGLIPIIEYDNNDEIMGSFEKELDLIDALNIVTSDRVNDICQTVQSILWLHNTKLSDEQKEQLVDGGVIQTQQTPDGKDAKIQYVNAPLNQTEIQTLASSLKERILESAGVPKLSDSTNTTGEATRLTNGWHIAETQAKTSELIWRSAEDATLEVCLAFIRNSEADINGISTLKLSDIDYKMIRSENYDITSRVNAFVTLADRGYDLVKAATYCKITDDPQQFIIDSEENVNRIRFSETQTTIEDKTVESIQPSSTAF